MTPSRLIKGERAGFSTNDADSADWGTLGNPLSAPPTTRLVQVVETPVANVRHAFYQTGTIVPHHRRGLATLVYSVGGPSMGRAGQDAERRLVFHPQGHGPSLKFCGPTNVLAIEILSPRILGEWPEASAWLPATLYDHIWRVRLGMVEGQPTARIGGELQKLLHAADLFLATEKPDWVLEVIEHLHGNWRPTQSARALSRRFGVSPQHLCRSFKRRVGVTIQQYSVMLRIDNARGLLWGSEMAITAVAATTGFSDQSHLTRVLAAHSQLSPARLRQTSPLMNLGGVPPRLRPSAASGSTDEAGPEGGSANE